MSSDNGIYILQTRGPEFRVAHHQNIEDIYGKFSDETGHWEGDLEMMWQYFCDAPMFSDEEKAFDYAEKLSYAYDYLEYGICLISDFKHIDFNSLGKDNGKEAESGSR